MARCRAGMSLTPAIIASTLICSVWQARAGATLQWIGRGMPACAVSVQALTGPSQSPATSPHLGLGRHADQARRMACRVTCRSHRRCRRRLAGCRGCAHRTLRGRPGPDGRALARRGPGRAGQRPQRRGDRPGRGPAGICAAARRGADASAGRTAGDERRVGARRGRSGDRGVHGLALLEAACFDVPWSRGAVGTLLDDGLTRALAARAASGDVVGGALVRWWRGRELCASRCIPLAPAGRVGGALLRAILSATADALSARPAPRSARVQRRRAPPVRA